MHNYISNFEFDCILLNLNASKETKTLSPLIMRTNGSVTESHGTEVHYEPKAPCKCGCKGDKSKWDASVPASPQFIRELNEEVKVLLEKAKQVRINGRPRYYQRRTRLMAGPYQTCYLYVVDLSLLQTLLRPFTSLASKV